MKLSGILSGLIGKFPRVVTLMAAAFLLCPSLQAQSLWTPQSGRADTGSYRHTGSRLSPWSHLLVKEDPVVKHPYTADDSVSIARVQARMDSIRQHRPTVAVVLSGGGAKGAAHIGVLRYLESVDMPIDMVLGTSMGGLVGGLYALGYDAGQIDSTIRTIDWNLALSDRIPREHLSYSEARYKEKYLLTIPFFYSMKEEDSAVERDMEFGDVPEASSSLQLGADKGDMTDFLRKNLLGSLPSGYIRGQNVFNIISGLSVGYQDSLAFSDLPIPFACVATNLVDADGLYWHSGRFQIAMRSTMSIPGVFAPVKTAGMVLVDGGMRDNYPVAEARMLGADIVIGVDLRDAGRTYETINNLGDIIGQGIDMLGRHAVEVNTSLVDLNIHPDLKEYNMMSFNEASIDTIIRRGWEAAIANSDAIASIKDRVGVAGRRLSNVPAKDINVSPVPVSGVDIIGVSEREREYLLRKIDVEPGDTLDGKAVESIVSMLYGTKAFEYVTYEMQGSEAPYRLVLNCKHGPVNRVGIGLRLDTEEVVAVMVNIGLNAYALRGSKLDLTSRISANPYVGIHYSFDLPKMPTVNVDASVRWTNINMLDDLGMGPVNMGMKYFETRQNIWLSNITWSLFDLKGGLRNRYFVVRSISNEINSPTYIEGLEFNMLNNGYLSLFFNGRADTFDDGYFPSKGFTAGGEYEWVFAGYPNSFGNFHVVSADAKGVVPIGKRFAWLPSASLRFVLGHDSGLIPYMNYMGESTPGRYFDQQMAFVGRNNVVPMDNILAVVRSDFRLRVGRNHYFTGIFNYARDCSKLNEFFLGSAGNWYGAGIEYAYDAFFGPVKADLHWSNIDTRRNGGFGFYLSIGYNF